MARAQAEAISNRPFKKKHKRCIQLINEAKKSGIEKDELYKKQLEIVKDDNQES